MARYPRRDLVHVAVSPQDGGCGASHTRPVTHGVPDPDWALICPQCEKAVDGNPLWSKTRAEIPETPDETTRRESLKNQKDRNLEEIQTYAMAKMAGIDVDDFHGSSAKKQFIRCKNDHSNAPESRYCSECGVSLSSSDEPSHIIVLPPGRKEPRAEAVAAEPNGSTDYAKLPVSELRRIADERGIDPAQSKKSLVEALA
jgi:hypothetical protein